MGTFPRPGLHGSGPDRTLGFSTAQTLTPHLE